MNKLRKGSAEMGESMKKRGFIGAGVLIAAGVFCFLPLFGSAEKSEGAQNPEPVFNRESGCYDEAFDLSVSAPKGSTIYYTTDGSIPEAKAGARVYSAPIRVKNRDGEPNVLASKSNSALMYNAEFVGPYLPEDSDVAKATVIRAMAVDAAGKQSRVVTKTYFVGSALSERYPNASVISIVTDPDNLMGAKKGIYRRENYQNSGREWERPAFVEYFEEDGTIPFAEEMGIRIHGGWSRHYGQKSFNLYFREEYGLKSLKDYALIPGACDAEGKQIEKYKSFMLRNGGNDTEYTKIQDVWIQNQVKGCGIATQAARPCVLFLNGEYWGLYNLTEKYSDSLLEEEFGVDKNNVIIFKDHELDEGAETDVSLYEELYGLAELDMKDRENYKKFCELVDVQSYIDYFAIETFIGNHDWPEKNIAFWRTREYDGTAYGDTKWRPLLFDTEFSMELYGSTNGKSPISWVRNRDKLFDALFENEQFKHRFAISLRDLMENEFEKNAAITSLRSYANLYKPLMEDYFKRFGLHPWAFDSNVKRIENFTRKRKTSILSDLKSKGIDMDNLDSWKEEEDNPESTDQPSEDVNNPDKDKTDGDETDNDKKDENNGGKKTPKQKKPAKVKKVKLTAKKKASLTVSWKKVSGVKGYQVVWAKNRSFSKKKNSAFVTSAKKAITGLHSGQTYYVKVRAYRKDSKKKTKQYGSFSAVKAKKVR